MATAKQEAFVEQLAEALISQGDVKNVQQSKAVEYDVKVLLVNAIDSLPASKLQTGLRKNATFHARKLLDLLMEAAAAEKPKASPKRKAKKAPSKKVNYLQPDAVEKAEELLQGADRSTAVQHRIASGGGADLLSLGCEALVESQTKKGKTAAAPSPKLGETADLCAMATMLNADPAVVAELQTAFEADNAAGLSQASKDVSCKLLEDLPLGSRLTRLVALLGFLSRKSIAEGGEGYTGETTATLARLVEWAHGVSDSVLSQAVATAAFHLQREPRGVGELLMSLKNTPLAKLGQLCSLVNKSAMDSSDDVDGYRLLLGLHRRLVEQKCKKATKTLAREILPIPVPPGLEAWMEYNQMSTAARNVLELSEEAVDKAVEGYQESMEEEERDRTLAARAAKAERSTKKGFFVDTDGTKLSAEEQKLLAEVSQLKEAREGEEEGEEGEEEVDVDLEGLEEEESSGPEEDQEEEEEEEQEEAPASKKRSSPRASPRATPSTRNKRRKA